MPGGLCYFIQQGFTGFKDDVSLLSQVPSLPPRRASQCENEANTGEQVRNAESQDTVNEPLFPARPMPHSPLGHFPAT